MSGYAVTQIKPISNRRAINRVNENLRLGAKYDEPNIVVIENNLATTSFKKIEKIRGDGDTEISKKINSLNANIRTYQNRILKLNPEIDLFKIDKMEQKIEGYREAIEELKLNKSGSETRGRKKEKEFIELIFSLTGYEPKGNNDLNNRFGKAQNEYIKKHFSECEIVVNAVHLDQYSLHSHAILKLPKKLNYIEYLTRLTGNKIEKKEGKKNYYEPLRMAYGTLARHFQHWLGRELGIKFEQMEQGKKYLGLKTYKDKIAKQKQAQMQEEIEEHNNFTKDTDKMYDEFLAKFDNSGAKHANNYQIHRKDAKNANSEPKSDTSTTPKIRRQR